MRRVLAVAALSFALPLVGAPATAVPRTPSYASGTASPAFTAPPVAKSTAPPSPSPSPSVAPPAAPAAGRPIPPLFVHGNVLTISGGFFIFTSGDAVRVASGLVIPSGVTTGSYVRVTIDQLARVVTTIVLEPRSSLAGEIDVASMPRQYVVVSPKSAPLPAPSGQSAAAGNSLVTVTIVVHVPGNTPSSDDVYLASDRSSYSPAEVRMNRVDGVTFSASVSLAQGTTLKYQFTRGSFATVERDRTGGIVEPHILVAAPNAKSSDTVARWADLS
jgi:hypothetical protein